MSKWEQFKEFLKTPKGKKFIIIFIIILIVLGALSWFIYNRYFKPQIKETNNNKVELAVKQEKIEEKEQSKLDGDMYKKDVANRHPIAVMVENHTEARPQAGLDKASIIYEAEAEGGITRFMPIFGPKDADKLGPVRSARTYFIDWALEYDAFYGHCGGNEDALMLLSEVSVNDLDQFTYGTQGYWRENENKATEHTLFTDTNKLREIAKANGWSTSVSDFQAFKFKKEVDSANRPESEVININFSGPLYNVRWVYDKNSNKYNRFMADTEHTDRITGEQLSAKNIIVQEIPRSLITYSNGDSGWQMETIGEGNALVFMDGKKIDAKWKKESRTSRTIFYDPTNTEIEFNPGVTWYEILPSLNDTTIE